MAHEMENMVGANVPAWHGLGSVIPADSGLTAEQVLRYVPELRPEVRPEPLWYRGADGEFRQVDGWQANVRSALNDDDAQLPEAVVGVVSDSYEIAQTRAQFALLDELVKAGELRYETAGSLAGGRRNWLLARMPGDVAILDDEVIPYVLVVNSFDGSYALTWALTPIRVVCQNTLSWAMQGVERSGRFIRLRHTSGVQQRMDEARRALGFSQSYLDALAVKAEHYAVPVDVEAFLARLVPMPKPDPKQDARDGGYQRKVMAASELRTVIQSIHDTAPNLQDLRGTGWGALQAVIEYEDHNRPHRGERGAERRMERITLGDRKLVEQADRVLAGMLS